jgi:disulfide bond formation protein DsbB
MQVTETGVKQNAVYTMLAIAVLGLAVVPVGTAVFVLGFIYGDSPCVMCWEQRIGMALVALIGLFVLRFGARPKYIGLSVLVGAWGMFMGLRHVGMHAARDIGQGFSAEILGAHTYTWSLLIFWVCIVTMGVLLMMLKAGGRADSPRELRPLETLAMVVFLLVIAGNIVQAFASTGPPPYMGQGDPVRFSFNPRHWVWSLEEWSPAPVSLRGRWAAEKPGVAAMPADPAAGPLANLPVLAAREPRLGLPIKGIITDLSYDAATDRFLATTQHGIYILDGGFQGVVRYTVVDPGYSVDLGDFAGAAFLDSRTVMALGENKSYVVLREDDLADADENFRYFLESFDKFSEVSRSRLATVRARMMYTMSLAFDPASKSLYTVTVPNSKSKRLIVSRFDRRDMTLSEEFAPVLKPDAGLALRGQRSLDEFCVTGATIDNGRMYVVSAAFSTLLTIDLATHQVIAAHAIPALERPTGLAVKGDTLYIACENGRVVTVAKPAVQER